MRVEPEPIQLTSPPTLSYAIGFSIAGGFLLFFGLCVAFSFRKKRKCCKRKNLEDDVEDASISSTDSYYHTAESPKDYYHPADHPSPPTPKSPKPSEINSISDESPSLSWKGKCRKFWTRKKIFSVGVLFTLIFLIIFFLTYPRAPDYSVCTTDVDWSSILGGIINNGTLTTDVALQMSFMNPNVFGFGISSIVGTFIYKGDNVGHGSVNNVLLAHSAITDFIMNTSWNPTILEAVSMLADYNDNSLRFDVDLEFNSDVNLWGDKIFDVSGDYEATDVDPVLPDPRKYCVCK